MSDALLSARLSLVDEAELAQTLQDVALELAERVARVALRAVPPQMINLEIARLYCTLQISYQKAPCRRESSSAE